LQPMQIALATPVYGKLRSGKQSGSRPSPKTKTGHQSSIYQALARSGRGIWVLGTRPYGELCCNPAR